MVSIVKNTTGTLISDPNNGNYFVISNPINYSVKSGKLIMFLHNGTERLEYNLEDISLESGIDLSDADPDTVLRELKYVLPYEVDLTDVQEFVNGSTYTITSSKAKEIKLYVAKEVTSATITLPKFPVDQQVIQIISYGGIDPLIVLPNGGYEIKANLYKDLPAPTSLSIVAGEKVSFWYNQDEQKMINNLTGSQFSEVLALDVNTHYPIIEAAGSTKTIKVATDVTSSFESGNRILIFNDDNTLFGKYTHVSDSYSAPNTSIIVNETIPNISEGSGKFVVRQRLN